MGFRYRRSRKIAPGVRINTSKSGTSVTFGGKYAKTTIGKGRVTNTYRTPIKGLSYTTTTRTGSKSSKRYTKKSSSKSGVGCLGILAGLCLFSLILYISVLILYFGIVAGLLYSAYKYYKVHKTYTPDQYERFASILYLDNPDEKRSRWKMYSDINKALKELPKEISALEYNAKACMDADVSKICRMLDERDAKQWQYQSLLEIKAEPEFYEPVYDNFYGETFKSYIDNTFRQVYMDAEKLLTQRAKKKRYVMYLDRFKPYYDQLPDVARVELDRFMQENDISFSPSVPDVDEGGADNE